PTADETVLIGADLHAFAAAVGHAAGRLEQQQTAVRSGWEQTPTARLFHQRVEIDFRLEAEQRDFETVLTARLTATAAGIAAQLGEDRHDLIGEIDRQIHVAALGRDRHLDDLVAEGGGDLGRAVGQRNDAARAGDAGDLLVGHLVLDVAG